MTCESCSIEHDGTYGSGRFCSSKCARGFSTKSKRTEINEKVSKSLQGNTNVLGKRWGLGHRVIGSSACLICGKELTIYYRSPNQKYCSLKCVAVKRGRNSAKSQPRRSKNEIFFAELCAETWSVKTNEPMFDGWDADVIIDELKIAVLWNGKWHYEKITKSHSVEQTQNRDRIKIKKIREAGYEPYVIKDMGRHNPDFVKQEFEKFRALILMVESAAHNGVCYGSNP